MADQLGAVLFCLAFGWGGECDMLLALMLRPILGCSLGPTVTGAQPQNKLGKVSQLEAADANYSAMGHRAANNAQDTSTLLGTL